VELELEQHACVCGMDALYQVMDDDDPSKRAVLAVMPLQDADAVLKRMATERGWRVVNWDILKEPSYLNDSIAVHRHLDKYLGNKSCPSSQSPSLKLVIRISNVDIDLATRSMGAIELLACINDPEVGRIVLVSSHDDPFGGDAMVSKKSKAQLDSLVVRAIPLASSRSITATKKSKASASASAHTHALQLTRDVMLLRLLSTHEDVCESYQLDLQSIAHVIQSMADH